MGVLANPTDRILRLAERGVEATDSDEERLRKTTFTIAVWVVVVVSFAWVGLYLSLGRPLAMAIPFAYQVITVVTSVAYLRIGDFERFRRIQLTLVLVLPFGLQWALGGFVNGSAVMLWAFFSPMAAVFFADRPWRWFIGFAALTAVSAVLDPYVAARVAPVPTLVRLGFFVLNVGTVTTLAFVLLRNLIRQRDEARERLAGKHRELEREQERSERLLLNVLPESIADRLKQGEVVIADRAEDVTVLFADIVGFTPLSARLAPRELVRLLDRVFTCFDEFAEEIGLEKIKTVGDSWFAVGGLPEPRPDHVTAVADLALAIRDAVADPALAAPHGLSVRIGVDTGPVVAGVIGRRKFSYDLWGDTVNTASRMESHGLPGMIQITERVRARLPTGYLVEPRGTIEVKGKGPMETYLLLGRTVADERARATVRT